jgi:hypothetical protein
LARSRQEAQNSSQNKDETALRIHGIHGQIDRADNRAVSRQRRALTALGAGDSAAASASQARSNSGILWHPLPRRSHVRRDPSVSLPRRSQSAAGRAGRSFISQLIDLTCM